MRIRVREDARCILFVCSLNRWRSPTAERLYGRVPGWRVRSAGTSARARRRVNAAEIAWADLILVMERKHLQRLRADFPEAMRRPGLEVTVLGIPDRHRFMAPELVAELRAAVDPLLPMVAE